MTTTSKLVQEYGFEKADVLLIRYLSKHPHATPSMISREIRLPRTTAHFRLKKLADRGFCVLKKVRNLSTWSLTSVGAGLLVKSKTTISEMSIAEGADALDETFLSLAGEPHSHRVYMFEPSEQTRLFTKHVNEQAYNRVSDLIKKHEIIVEVLIGERTLEHVSHMSEETRKHMYGRPTIAHELPDDILNFEHMIICFREDTYFFNYNQLTVMRIHSEEVTNTYRSMFELYKTFGKRVDFNQALKV